MRFRSIVLAVAVLGMALVASPAQAAITDTDQALVLAAIGGSRTITSVTPMTVSDVAGSGYTVVVTELARLGSTSWQVNAQLCQPDDYDVPANPDCVGGPNQLLGSSSNALAGSAFAVTGRDNDVVASVGSPNVAADSTATTFGGLVTLGTVTQDPSTLYSAVYTLAGSVSLNPGNATAGLYKGYLVVTLVV